jgi:(E)-4-hydroxy-3-methylbut-2-enyl-diphosphate synthase
MMEMAERRSAPPAAGYTAEPYRYRRRRTHVVMVGDVGVGGDHPIRVQSMTTTLTQDVAATVAQTIRLVEAGCEIVRVTTPSTQDARALGEIKRRLRAQGIRVPLVADIHFNPAAALEAANYADKVRINPGNYADKKAFTVREYSDAEYAAELERIAERFRPLVRRCKQNGVAMRIGTNHGSLSDRIMNRYGDTPEGMVESALEFVRICEEEGYRDVIFSMKASNPKVMVQAYRLLVARLEAAGMTYPLHLGVTEAGGGEDGRIKSAIGIGALLEDGLGDTIRVSLTEEPEAEIPVALALARRYTPATGGRATAEPPYPLRLPAVAPLPDRRDPYHVAPRPVAEFMIGPVPFGGRRPARVVAELPDRPAALADVAAAVRGWLMPVGQAGLRPDLVVTRLAGPDDLAALPALATAVGAGEAAPGLVVDVSAVPQLAAAAARSAGALRVRERVAPADGEAFRAALAAARQALLPLWLEVEQPGEPAALRELAARHAYPAVDRLLARVAEAAAAGQRALVLGVVAADRSYRIWAHRLLDSRLRAAGLDYPVHLATAVAGLDDAALLDSSIGLGALLVDGIGQSVQIDGTDGDGRARRLRLAFDILQGSGARATKTEFIACPSCGRTLFDLQTTTERIQKRMAHLVGVKIAVMGCVVNGLGELADADFGYMGSGVGKVNLYVGKECVARNLPAEEADERLVELIKAHGRWVDPPTTES